MEVRSIQKITEIFSLGNNYVFSVKYVKLDILNLFQVTKQTSLWAPSFFLKWGIDRCPLF